MPAKPGKERPLLELFLGEYEAGAWKGAAPYWADEHEDGAVEVIATRSDGRRLAIEHTLIQPFMLYRETGRNLELHFFPLRGDPRLFSPGHETELNVPVAALRNGAGWDFSQLAVDISAWLASACLLLPSGTSIHDVPTTAGRKAGVGSVRVCLTLWPSPGSSGLLRFMMYGDEEVPDTVTKALRTKLGKLKAAPADRRILLLEREEMSLDERKIVAELDAGRPVHTDIAAIDEIWVVETVATRRPNDQYIEFKRYAAGMVVDRFGFYNRRLMSRSKNGMPLPLQGTANAATPGP